MYVPRDAVGASIAVETPAIPEEVT